MNAQTVMNLYKGIGYEYHTISVLKTMGYEAQKLDADYGFDILVNNQRERTFEGVQEDKVYQIQVKSRVTKPWKTETGAGIRQSAIAEFEIWPRHLMKLIHAEDSILVCYFVVRGFDGSESILGEFWLSSPQLKAMYEYDKRMEEGERFFQKAKDINGKFKERDGECKLRLKAYLATKADAKALIQEKLCLLEENFNKLKQKNSIDAPEEFELINKQIISLDKWIEKTSLVNANSHTYTNIYCGLKKLHLLTPFRDFYNFDKVCGDSNELYSKISPFMNEPDFLITLSLTDENTSGDNPTSQLRHQEKRLEKSETTSLPESKEPKVHSTADNQIVTPCEMHNEKKVGLLSRILKRF